MICCGVILKVNGFFQCLRKLIGAGSLLHAAGRSLQPANDLIDLHAFYQGGDPLQVAVAAADVLNAFYLAVSDLKKDPLGAGAFGFVFVLHNNASFHFF